MSMIRIRIAVLIINRLIGGSQRIRKAKASGHRGGLITSINSMRHPDWEFLIRRSMLGCWFQVDQENVLMKAVRLHQFGGPEVLTYEDVPDPQPRKDQVLVRVRACSLNHLDIWVRKGLPGVKLPHILGSDVAGEVVEQGEYVSGFKAGQRVLLAPMHYCGHCEKCVAGLQNQCRQFTALGNAVDGGNCELIAVPASKVIPIPDSPAFT